MTTDEFIKEVNRERLANKNKWVFLSYVVNGLDVDIKAYNTYLQIFRVNGMHVASGMGMNVTEFKDTLKRGVE